MMMVKIRTKIKGQKKNEKKGRYKKDREEAFNDNFQTIKKEFWDGTCGMYKVVRGHLVGLF